MVCLPATSSCRVLATCCVKVEGDVSGCVTNEGENDLQKTRLCRVMSVLKVYLNWANSILSEVGRHVDGTADIQEGRSLCELIDVLAPDAYLVEKCEASGGRNPRSYIQTALEHLQSHGIKFVFTVQDLLDGDIKSLLDVLWLIILNYSIHDIAQNTYQRSVGIGKKNLLDWCQQEVDAIFDPRNTLTFNLCTGHWFTRLIHKFSGIEQTENEDRVSYLEKLLHKIQKKYAISKDIVSASDIVDGTVDEHTLMIYLSLLKRRVGGNRDTDLSRASYRLTLPPGGLNLTAISQTKRSRSASPLVSWSSPQEEEEKYCSDSELFSRLGAASRNPRNNKLPRERASRESVHLKMSQRNERLSGARSHESVDDGSDWFSSTSGSMISSPVGRLSPGKDGRMTPLDAGREQVLNETISQQVWEHMPQSEGDEGQGEVSPPRPMLNNAHNSNADSHVMSGSGTDSSETVAREQHRDSQFVDSKAYGEHADGRYLDSKGSENTTDSSSDIKIRRPKDYFRQWEDTIDRLSHGPVSSDSSRSSSRSRSRSHESNRILGDGPYKSSTYLERDSLRSLSNSPSRSLSSHRASYTFDSSEQFSYRKSSPSPQRLDADLSRSKEVSNLGRRTEESAASGHSRQGEASVGHQSSRDLDERQERSGEKPDSETLDAGRRETDSRQQLLEIQHLLTGADLKDLTLSLKPGQKVDVVILFEALRKAREAVDNNMPKDDFRSRRLLQQDLAETELKMVQSDAAESGLRSAQLLDKETVDQSSPNERLEESQLSRIHSPGRDIRDVERDRSPSAVIGLSRRHPSMSPRRMPMSREPIRDDFSSGHDGRSLEGGGSFEGGYGRVPRREAWERRRQRNSDNISLDASRMDSLSQAKFVEVLCQEIEELKHKVEVMDQPREMVSHPSSSNSSSRTARHGQRTDYGDIDRIENPFRLQTDIHDENGRMLFETSRSRSASPRYSQNRTPGVKPSSLESSSYRYQERLGRSLNMDSHEALRSSPDQPRSRSLSPHLERQSVRLDHVEANGGGERSEDFRNRTTPPGRPELRYTSGVSPWRYGADVGVSRRVTSLGSSSSTPDLSQQHLPISLGYSSPVRSVSQEIWGNKLTGVEGLTPHGHDRWKQLISNRNLTDEDVIELKQALASSIVENDILQAKLNNAKAEVSEKLYQTNGILDDCRKHLAKSQAENMELRSSLERERQQRQDLEVRVKELEDGLYQSKSDASQLEAELDRTRDELNRTIRDEPTLEEMRKENRLLQGDLGRVESVSSSLKQEVEDLHLTQEKAQATIRDLRTCLEEVRQERSQLFEEVMSLQLASNDQKAKVQSIIHRYNDKDVKEAVNGQLQDQSFSPGNQRDTSSNYRDIPRSRRDTPGTRRDTRRPEVAVSPIRINSQSTPKGHQRTSTLNDEVMTDGCSKLDGSLNLSGIIPAGPVTAGYVDLDASCSPGVPSSYREIYPHRKSRYHSRDVRESPVLFLDYPDLQQYPTKLSGSKFDSEDQPSRRDVAHSFRDLSHSNFIRRKLRYSPVHDRDGAGEDQELPWFLSADDFLADASIVDTVVESPVSGRRPPVRLSQSLHESSTRSPHRHMDGDRLNRSYSSVYDLAQARSDSLGHQTGRRGILKNGKSPLSGGGSRLRERSCSPVLQHCERPHSPPTRLSPRSRSPGSWSCGSRSSPRPSLLGRSYSTTCLERSVQQHLENEAGSPFCDPQLSSMKRKAWYELQMQTPAVLNDEQRRYADHLIEKYTGMPLPDTSLPVFQL
ncbi:uncharacterized protein LOC121378692 [Gigantopelta aegis]|uniref:uncharacterized protein LOC121378692 n=1 Tax=Gigantopelta aegis TaxID=1735272 RepID=UPI001B88923A|nr:uncharacterized protein LOC121378692 [Gigantopelta aegis]